MVPAQPFQSQRPGTPTLPLVERIRDYLEDMAGCASSATESRASWLAEAYREKKYTIILQVAARLPEEVRTKIPDLLMYFDTSQSAVTAESH